ncbi:protein yellow-like isoform X2 [Cylas formicarius]|uniref:protein yellow-like isoform X2 n=1 Tax=Cylas formicarius TaxID=197179 RepID=UPI0029589494|nr:protein yellow-like isoform X2 [Cylas formicarius]
MDIGKTSAYEAAAFVGNMFWRKFLLVGFLMSSTAVVAIITVILALVEQYPQRPFRVQFEWEYINFTWNSAEHASQFGYVAGEDVITGIKVYRDTVYLTLIRNKTSARVTLATVSLKDDKHNPLLKPYPNWDFNSGQSCSSLLDVLSVEIDPNGVLWALDGTRRSNLTQCPGKLMLFDTNDNGKLIQTYNFPEEICAINKRCFLDDLVVDGDWAFISDITAVDPGIVVYNRFLNKSWKVRDKATMRADPLAFNFTLHGVRNIMFGNINGIALSPVTTNPRLLYYTPQMSFHIYSIPTTILKQENVAIGNVSQYVTNHGRKKGATDGMICDSEGTIYFGLSPLDQINKWDTSEPLDDSEVIERNSRTLIWPDGFSVYGGYIYVVTNNMLKFREVGINITDINFRVMRYRSGTRSYMYPTDL